MNYITIINNFWTKQLTAPVSSGATALFFYLLQQANKRRWEFPITLTNPLIQAELHISKNSFIRYRGELVCNGYITYDPINTLVGGAYTITVSNTRAQTVKSDTNVGTNPETVITNSGTNPSTNFGTGYGTEYGTNPEPTSGLSSYNNINQEKEKDLNKDFKQKRFYNNKKYNDKEIYNSGRYDFERIERVARRKILEEVRKYDEEEGKA